MRVPDRSKQTLLTGCVDTWIVPISVTVRTSHNFTTPSASQDATTSPRALQATPLQALVCP